ncbi:MAG: sugar ABC transporter substrate-binding protein [Gammaproteobacteria bacterium]|nr:sugar ABC transporter substrate-binding protein [Gammaproteobacteria bacterium]
MPSAGIFSGLCPLEPLLILRLRLFIGLVLGLLSFGVLAEVQVPIRVGVLYWSMQIPGQVAMRQGLEAEVERINQRAAGRGLPPVELIAEVAGDGEAGIRRQIEQMSAMVARRPDIIIVQPTDNAALAEPLLAANAAGIPVVAYDQYISGGRLDAFVTSDNRQAGYLNGEFIADRFADDREIGLILVEYPHVSSTVERLNGFLDALAEHRQPYRILKTYKAVQPEEGRRAGEAILRDFPAPGSVDVVFSVNDGGGLSVVAMLAAAGRREIIVASIDGDPAAVQRIDRQELIHIDSAQFCGPLGAEAMKTAYAIATGAPFAREVLVPVFPVTRDTLQLYPGWLGPIPEPFRKPWTANKPLWDGQIQTRQ